MWNNINKMHFLSFAALNKKVLQHPHAITIFEDFVYWTDRYINRVIRAHKWHGENQTVMLYNLPQPMGLVAVHPSRQPAGRTRTYIFGMVIGRLKIYIWHGDIISWYCHSTVLSLYLKLHFRMKPEVTEHCWPFFSCVCYGTRVQVKTTALAAPVLISVCCRPWGPASTPVPAHQAGPWLQTKSPVPEVGSMPTWGKRSSLTVWLKRKWGQMEQIDCNSHNS